MSAHKRRARQESGTKNQLRRRSKGMLCNLLHASLFLASTKRHMISLILKAQTNLVLSTSFVLKDNDASGLIAFFQDIVGFFVIERVILRSIQNFRLSSEIDALWDTVTSKAVQIIYAALYGCIESKLFTRVKKELTVFMQTLEVIYTRE